MKDTQFSNSVCRLCRFYEPEGRRGGSCQKLGVPVKGSWEACSLASSPFDTTLKKLEDIFQLETSILLDSHVLLASTVVNLEVEGDLPEMASPKVE